jgi:pimeloyl-ACP methyl ester carboxylesterase
MGNVKIQREIIKINDVDIFYMDTQTQAEAILCLHGRWGRAETWADFIQHYGEKYRVIAPDQRGHGLSGKPVSKYTSAEMASDILGLMDHLKINQVILVGHSMGASIAGYFAAAYPDRLRGVAILDKTAAGPEKPNTTPLEEIPAVDPITKDWPLPFSTLKEARDCIKNAEKSELSYQYFMNSLTEDLDGYHMLFSAQAMAATIAYYQDWFDLLPKIKCPVLLVRAGGQGAVTDEDFSRMQAMIPDCLAFDMSDPDHNVHLSNPEEFYGYFDKLLGKVEGR